MAWEREKLSLRVECKKIDLGCTWIGELRHYEVSFRFFVCVCVCCRYDFVIYLQ